MEDIVALRVRVGGQQRDRFILTWGRVFGRTDPTELVTVVKSHIAQFSLGGPMETVELCASLQEASGAPYFFESFFKMCQQQIQFGDAYDAWAVQMRDRIQNGRELHYLG